MTQNLDKMYLRDLQFIISEDSLDSPQWDVYVGNTPQSALGSSSKVTGTVPTGRSTLQPIQQSGYAIWMKLSGISRIVYETCRANIQTRGRIQQRSAT